MVFRFRVCFYLISTVEGLGGYLSVFSNNDNDNHHNDDDNNSDMSRLNT